MLTPKAKHRLRKLVKNVREDVVDRAFIMDHFVEKNQCGTAMCMAGWATRFLPETGLMLGYDQSIRDRANASAETSLRRAFDITLSQVDELFFAHLHMNREETCDRFERFIKSGGKRELLEDEDD